MSVIYETLLAQTADAGWSGEFYTPRPVVEFIVDVVRPQIGETVYDPCCGSAGFLVGAAEYMKRQVRVGSDEATLETRTFFGQESGDLAHLVGTMNLILHGVTEPNTLRVNTLEQNVMNVAPADQHSVILTNPPFGGTENPVVQQNFSARSAATELLFLQHCMSKLRKGGRAAIVLPDGILYRSITAFSTVRRRLVNDYRLTGVVRLPTGVFPTAPDTRTNILFFERTPTTDVVRYYQVRPPIGKRSYSKTNPLPRTALAGAQAWLVDGVADENSWVVTRAEIDEEGHLDFSHPDDGATSADENPAERVDDLRQGSGTLDQMVADLDAVVENLDAMAVARWTALDEYIVPTGFRAGSRVPDRFLGVSNTGGIGPFKGSPGDDLTRYRRVSIGDFVYNPMRVDVGSIALCRTEAETGWASPDYVVFRLNDDAPFSREYLLAYLKSADGRAEIVRRSRGAVRRRLYYDDLRNVEVPVPEDPDVWESVVTGLAALRAHVVRLQGLATSSAASVERALFARGAGA
nr:N-6 DNA methylase [Cellulomonas sp. JH27-2]